MSHLKVFGGNQRDKVAQSISLQHELDTFDDGRSVNTKKNCAMLHAYRSDQIHLCLRFYTFGLLEHKL